MPTLNDDLTYLQSVAESLEQFLLSDEIYWPLGGRRTAHLPRLSLGGVLLASLRAGTYPKTEAQRRRWENLTRDVDAVRTRWRVAWERKAQREFEARLRQWKAYLNEYRENPGAQAGYYPYEVRLRVMLDLLAEEIDLGSLPEHISSMYTGLDALLRAVFVPGDFVWDETLQEGMPKERFWYLYGKLRA